MSAVVGSAVPTFEKWPSTPRLYSPVTITEKIDGTNGGIIIKEPGIVSAQSRHRIVTPDDDNYGFAAWVYENAGALYDVLGPGRHFGEWWGSGIRRGYNCNGCRHFSLFNVTRWQGDETLDCVDGLKVVPVLWTGEFHDEAVSDSLEFLRTFGSVAHKGYAAPEGVCVYFENAEQVFKAYV